MWKLRLLSTHQLYFPFCSSMLGSLFLPCLRVLSWSLSLILFLSSLARDSISFAFTFASSLTRRLSVSSRTHCFSLDPEVLYPLKDGLYTNWENVLRTMKPKYNSCLLNLDLDIYPCLQSSTKTWLLPDAYEVGANHHNILGHSGGGLKCHRQWIDSLHNFHQLTSISAVHHFHIEAPDLHFFKSKGKQRNPKCNYLLTCVVPIHPFEQ